ncbi:MAG: hypothetical protein ACFFG0_00595 [Candidatus Thorarchaeota archaeon]
MEHIGELKNLRIPITIESKDTVIRIMGILEESYDDRYKGVTLIFFKKLPKCHGGRWGKCEFKTKKEFIELYDGESFKFSSYEHGQ